MGPSGAACHCAAKADVGHAQPLEQAHQPAALFLVGIQRYVEALAVVKPHAPMHGGRAPCADRQRARELLEISGLHAQEILIGQRALSLRRRPPAG